MLLTDTIIAVALIAALVIIVALGFRTLALRSLHRVVTTAIEQNSPELPTLVGRLGQRPRISLRLIAYVLLAVAAALVIAGALEGTLKDLKETVVAAIFPGFVAVAILLHLRARDRAVAP